MSFIPDPTSVAEAMAHSLGAGLTTALITVLLVAIFSLLKLPKLVVIVAGASLLVVSQAGSVTDRVVRGGCVLVVALLTGLLLRRRPPASSPRLIYFVLLPIGVSVLAIFAVIVGNAIVPGAFVPWSGICGVATALAVASVFVYGSGRWQRIGSVLVAVVVGAFANSIIDLYRPLQVQASAVSTPAIASVQKPFTIVSQGNVLSVELPAGVPLPSKQDTIVVGSYGYVPVTTYAAEEPSGDTFIASVSTLPEKAFDRYTPSQVLDGWRNNSLAGMGARATSQEELMLSGHEGRRMYFESANPQAPLFGRMDCVLARPHLCQVGFVSARKEAVSEPSVADFFTSTRIEGVMIYTR